LFSQTTNTPVIMVKSDFEHTCRCCLVGLWTHVLLLFIQTLNTRVVIA